MDKFNQKFGAFLDANVSKYGADAWVPCICLIGLYDTLEGKHYLRYCVENNISDEEALKMAKQITRIELDLLPEECISLHRQLKKLVKASETLQPMSLTVFFQMNNN